MTIDTQSQAIEALEKLRGQAFNVEGETAILQSVIELGASQVKLIFETGNPLKLTISQVSGFIHNNSKTTTAVVAAQASVVPLGRFDAMTESLFDVFDILKTDRRPEVIAQATAMNATANTIISSVKVRLQVEGLMKNKRRMTTQ